MTIAAAPLVGWSRVVLLTDAIDVRGTAAEFRHFGLRVDTHHDVVAALIGLARDHESILVVSSDIQRPSLSEALDLGVALCGSAVILGLGEGDAAAAVRVAIAAGVHTIVDLPLTPERLHEAIRKLPDPTTDLEPVQAGQLRVDPGRHQVEWRGTSIDVTPREFAVLLALARAHPFMATLDQLAVEYASTATDPIASIRVAINRIRARLTEAGAGSRTPIETVRGVGYRLAS